MPKTFREFRENEEKNPSITGELHGEPIHLSQKMGDITVLPAPDAKTGEFGFVIIQEIDGEKREEKCISPMMKVFDVTEIVDCDREQIEKEYEKAVNNNYYVISADDPKKLKLGFVSVKGDGCIWYACHVSKWKEGEKQARD